MAAIVHLMPPAKRKLDPALYEQTQTELGLAFPLASAVTVYDVLQGFQANQRKKLILAVETESVAPGAARSTFESHVVKLGERKEVIADAEGWRTCVQGRQISQRMFVSVQERELSGRVDRAAVVYQSASQWYGMLTPDEQVATLAWTAERSVLSDDVQVLSVERVARQVFRELGRSLYLTAADDGHLAGPARAGAAGPAHAATRGFYRSKLRLDARPPAAPAVHLWKEPDFWTLRRDADWLLCGALSPAGNELPAYIDPYDFVLWALEHESVPPTLVGPSHGDLHAGNVIVGLAGSEVEYPLLIDYGDMAPDNVIAWDFVKFETELKVRLLARLFGIAAVRDYVWGQVRSRRFQKLVERWARRPDLDPLTDRTQWIVFAFEFERRLAERSGQLLRSPRECDMPTSSPSSPFDRAVLIIQAVRCQAAEQLGRVKGRTDLWNEELDFALAVYGVSTIKFSEAAYPIFQRLFALVSAGTAAARLKSVRDPLSSDQGLEPCDQAAWSSYHVPLRCAYRQWKANAHLHEAEKLLAAIARQFDYSVPFRREHSLLLSKLGRVDDALRNIEGIAAHDGAPSGGDGESDMAVVSLCASFLEFEVLSRIGRIYKDKADACWEKLELPFEKLRNHSAAQFYRSAYRYYRSAFEISREYYPGGNAAVTALLASDSNAHALAEAVAHECEIIVPGSMPVDERYWMIATEGDMALILGDSEGAANFYQAAINELPEGNGGMVQSTYNQLCRLYKALGAEKLHAALAVFRRQLKFRLQPGPLGDCDGLTTRLM